MSDVPLEQCEQCKAPVGFHMSDCPSCAPRFPEQVTRWQPCEIDSEDGEEVFQGFLTDPAGEWVKWEDLNRVRVAAYNLELEQKHAALKLELIKARSRIAELVAQADSYGCAICGVICEGNVCSDCSKDG